ncbi:MAG: hypothetical protein ABIG29_01645 [Candidatus Nealsonbacteria bacterium]
MKIDDIVIMPHAIKRFRERYAALNGIQLSDAELSDRLRTLIAKAKPEKENSLLQLRKEAHGGIGEYFIALPWRFVFSERGLETCEIVPQDIFVVENPYILPPSEKIRFYLKVNTSKKNPITEITRSSDRKTLHLRNSIEINTIVRALRIIGLEVNHLKEPRRLEIVIPQNIVSYFVEQLAEPEDIMISLGRTDSFRLGLQKAHCSGIAKADMERILEFLQINKS